MSKLPSIGTKHKVCVICEGEEDFAYFTRLTELAVWNSSYEFKLINAKSASNIPAAYENYYQNNSYEAILIFCDTDKSPYREYFLVKQKISDFHGENNDVLQRIIIFANPCTMQIVLSHFGDVHLVNQGKKTNADIIEQLTGVANYDAHSDQIKAICAKIFRRTYSDMRYRVATINLPDIVSGSTNFIEFLPKFELADTTWIQELRNCLIHDN